MEFGNMKAPLLSATTQGNVASKISIPFDTRCRRVQGVTGPWKILGRFSGKAP